MEKRENRGRLVQASCPGKVLLVGGYLILEEGNEGAVLSTTSRFYSTLEHLEFDASTGSPPAFTSPSGKALGGDSSLSSLLASAAAVLAVSAPQQSRRLLVAVRSPQFRQSWLYDVRIADEHGDATPPDGHDAYDQQQQQQQQQRPTLTILQGDENPYVENALALTFTYLCSRMSFADILSLVPLSDPLYPSSCAKILSITLSASNDFYSQTPYLLSQGLPPTLSNLSTSVPPFNPIPRSPSGSLQLHKTGLGSSATLTTSLIGCLLRYFFVPSVPPCRRPLSLLHNLSQISHCLSQGKIGSGFDVAAAVHGSIAYRRFSPEPLSSFFSASPLSASRAGEGPSSARTIEASKAGAELLASLSDDDGGGDRWAGLSAERFKGLRGMTVVMADVQGGSDTPSMARQVLDFKERGGGKTAGSCPPEWEQVKAANRELLAAFHELATFSSAGHLDGGDPALSRRLLDRLGAVPHSQWLQLSLDESSPPLPERDLASSLCLLRSRFSCVRNALKALGVAAGVPVEPDGQTALADETEKLPGVVACGVPGAGGDDALFCVCLSHEAKRGVVRFWESYGGGGGRVCPLLVEWDVEGQYEDEETLFT